MFETGADKPTSGAEPGLGNLVVQWSRDPRFGLRLSADEAVWLVLDGTAERILLASSAASGLRQGLGADASGRVMAAIRLAEQLRPRGLPLDRPALVKVRFDARRLGPATTCQILRTKDAGGANVLILAVLDRLPGLRAPSRQPEIEPSAPPVEVEVEVAVPHEVVPPTSPRVIWRSDADDRLTDVSGPAAGSISPSVIGRTWAALSQARTLLDAEGLLLALAERRTFRSISVTLRVDDAPGALDLDISGTPIQRAGLDFKGFNGFAVVRPSLSPPEPLSDQERGGGADPSDVTPPTEPRPHDDAHRGDAVSSDLDTADTAPVPEETPVAERAVILSVADDFAGVATTREPADQPALARTGDEAQVPREDATSESDRGGEEFAVEPASVGSNEDRWTEFQDPHLTSNEHAAFREIARALGARFAGDPDPAEPAPPVRDRDDRPSGGSVTPFPTPMARPAEQSGQDANAAVVETLERLPGGVMVYRGGGVLFANRRLLEMAGFSGLSELASWGGIGRLFGGLAPHERPVSDAPAILVTATGGSLSVDLQSSELDWRGMPAQLLLIRDAMAGEPARERVALHIADAFAGARAADAQAVLDSLEDGVVTLDRNARIIGLNRSAAATFGLDPREIVGAGILSLFAPESAVDVLASVHGVAGPAATTVQSAPSQPAPDVVGRTAAGPVPVLIKVAPLPGRDDGRMAMTIRDARAARSIVAEASSARHAAEYASARKSDFLAKISHEIRTPMNGILGFADMMLAEPFGPLGNERYRDYLGDIHASGTHVLSLVNDLLDLAKIEAGRLDLTFAEVPLNDVVSHCVAMLQPQAMRDRIVVRTSFSADLGPLVADERSVRQAALNIIANAIEFTEAGGQVIVSTTMADRGEIALRVRDTGVGMTPDEVETALEPFRQIAVAGPRKGKGAGRSTGTGLGLPLTKALVEANHGRFRIESRKDEGTLVEMLFPPQAAIRSA